MNARRTPLADAFLQSAEQTLRSLDGADLEERLEDLLADARAVWPELAVDDLAFLRHVASHTPDIASLDRVHADELLLAFGCACGVDAALRTFDRVHGAEMRVLAERLLPAALAQEVVQTLEQQLLVATADRPPGIAQFSGQGKMRGWLRVITVREAVRVRKKKGLEPTIDDALEAVGAEGDDPELRYMKALYKTEFREAFTLALGNLTGRERTLLRYTVIDGLNVDRVGAIYRVHRATAARWVAHARERLVVETRRELTERLAVGGPEQDSILRLIRSDLDLSIRTLLREDAS